MCRRCIGHGLTQPQGVDCAVFHRGEELAGAGVPAAERFTWTPLAGRSALHLRGALDGPQLQPGMVLPSRWLVEVPHHIPGAHRVRAVTGGLTLLLGRHLGGEC